MPADFIERISKGPVLCDGGYYLEFERRCLGRGRYYPGNSLGCAHQRSRRRAASGRRQNCKGGLHDRVCSEDGTVSKEAVVEDSCRPIRTGADASRQRG